MSQPVVRRSSRPGAGQSRYRAPRGWHPDSIVDAYLLGGEDVLLEETRSVRGFLLTQLPLCLAAMVVAGFVISRGVGLLSLIAVSGLLLLALVVAYRALQAWFTRYVVTDMRVLRVSGILNRQAEFIPWRKVTDITRRESLLQWLAHSATIQIDSANEKSGFRVIDDIDDPDRFYKVIVEMVDLKQGRLET